MTKFHLQGALSWPRAASNLSKGPSPAIGFGPTKGTCSPNKSIDNLWNFARTLGHVLHDFSMDSCERPIATNPYRNWQKIQILKLFFGPCGKNKLIYMVGGLVVIVCSDIIETYHVCPNKKSSSEVSLETDPVGDLSFFKHVNKDSQWFKNQLSVCKRKTTPTINKLHSSLFNTATPPYLVHIRDLQ